MARSWQATSCGVVNWSMWWTVRRHRGTALAEMQSWAWTTSNASQSHAVGQGGDRAHDAVAERLVRRPRSIGAIADRAPPGRPAGRTPRSRSRQMVATVTSTPRAASASARASVWTTPPRGRVE